MLDIYSQTRIRNRYFTYVVQDDHWLSPATVSVADGVEKAIANKSGDKLFNEENQEYSADSSEVKVMDQE